MTTDYNRFKKETQSAIEKAIMDNQDIIALSKLVNKRLTDAKNPDVLALSKDESFILWLSERGIRKDSNEIHI